MYIETIGSAIERIYGIDCHVPKLGYGINSVTGKLEKTDIIKRSYKPSEQYWERTRLPDDWAKRRKLEMIEQETNIDYYDSELERFRAQEWRRRLCGLWFYVNGTPTYITGEHYMYINWWQLDIGYPDYREPDRRRYYFLQYCIEDPRCAGMVEAANRRSGKSYRGGLFVYEYVSRTKDANGGIQSKTDKDGSNLFKGKLVTPFRRLPDFFRPDIDTSASTSPERELRLTKPKRRGKEAYKGFDDFGLNSFIDFKPSEMYAYDGWKLHRYLGDEVGKTFKLDIYERHQIVKYCLRIGKNWVGKALYTTTVERPDETKASVNEIGFSKAFEQLWKDSDPDVRDANGHTKSGLYKYFTPAYEMFEFDKFGQPLIEEGKQFYLNTRAGLLMNPRKLSGEIAKNPFNEVEMFRTDGAKCLYDSEKLNDRLSWLSWHPECTERGNFKWSNGERFTKVVWEKDNNGRYEITYLPKEEESNKVERTFNIYIPKNVHVYSIGCDPFKFNKVRDNRRSDCAAFVGQKYDVNSEHPEYNGGFVCRYLYRAATTAMQYEDVLKMAWFYGAQILFESNVTGWKDYFTHIDCHHFLMKLPGQDDYGLYSDGHGKTIQQLCDYTEAHIDNDIDKVWFPSLIDEWLEFKVEDTTQYDQAIAAGYTLIAMKKKFYKRNSNETGPEVTNFVRSYVAI